MLLLLTVVLVGFAATLILTPLMRGLSYRYNLVDYPDWQRKMHSRPTPLGGGVTVLAGTVVAVTAAYNVPHPWTHLLADGTLHLLALFFAALTLCAVGLADDYFHLRARHKVMGQLVAALVVVMAGLQAERVQFICWEWELGLLAVPFTLFWILGSINALNLLDGSDGVATTVGIVISVALAVMALMLPHREVEAVVALSLAGSLLAFLFFNFPPASIFLGDAGSTIIGLVIGVLALRSGLKGPATIALAAPIAIFAIPIFDTGMAILRRKLTGRSLYTADRGHLHHCLLRRGLSSRRTAIIIGTLCACTAAVALISVYRRNELLAIIGTAAVLATLVLTGLFGHSESRILLLRLAQAVRSFLAESAELHEGLREERIHVAGKHTWDELWKAVVVIGQRCNASTVRLDLDIPSVHEEFHLMRDSKNGDHADHQWYADLPLVANGRSLGRIQLGGSTRHGFSYSSLAEFIPMLEAILQSIPLTNSQTEVVPKAGRALPATPTFPAIDVSTASDAIVQV